jgi:hypothetical protein
MCDDINQQRKFWIVTSDRSLGSHLGVNSKFSRRYIGTTMWRAVYHTLDDAKKAAAGWLGMKAPFPEPPPRVCIVECNVVGYMTPPDSPLPIYTPAEDVHA